MFQVRRPEDVYLYLWKAHNKVNARLHGRETEDPKFPKYQFPAKFLCVDCNAKGFLNEDDTQPFLIDYYSRIRPFTNSTLIKSNWLDDFHFSSPHSVLTTLATFHLPHRPTYSRRFLHIDRLFFFFEDFKTIFNIAIFKNHNMHLSSCHNYLFLNKRISTYPL